MRLGTTYPVIAVRRIGRTALDLILPPRCLACGVAVADNGTMCGSCWGKLNFLVAPVCSCCGLPFPFDAGADALCPACIADAPAFTSARSALVYDDASRGLILAFKHGDRLHGAALFGQWLARAGAATLADAELIAPVPLHWTRLWRRRYNQSAVLAQALIRACGTRSPIFEPELLIRRRATPSQGHRSPAQRALNVRGAFRHNPKVAVAGRNVVLVDDVMTSSATVAECARILRRAGAARVDVLTLARALKLA